MAMFSFRNVINWRVCPVQSELTDSNKLESLPLNGLNYGRKSLSIQASGS
jgi:hypothetical protein